MKKKIAVITIVVLIIVGLVQQTRDETAASKAYSSGELIRFHVIANSNSPSDQAVKYKVRDHLVSALRQELSRAKSVEEARNIILRDRDKISRLAGQTLHDNGYSYPVSVALGSFQFPTRAYGQLVLPAGRYEALRVVLGDGRGANWWCVLFPPLCFVDIAKATSGSDAALDLPATTSLTIDNKKEVSRSGDSQTVTLRFRLLDWFNGEGSHLARLFHT
jgi:stage II sporulation protein R